VSPDRLLVETARSVLVEHQSPASLVKADVAGWNQAAWNALVNLGFQWMSVPVAAGGAGGSVADMLAVVTLTGASAPAVPLADSGLLAGWLLSEAGWPLPRGPVAVIPPRSARGLTMSLSQGRLTIDGSAPSVPWASISEQVLLLTSSPDGVIGHPCLVRLDPRALEIQPHRNLAGEARDLVITHNLAVGKADVVDVGCHVTPAELERRGALARSASLVGAIGRVRDMTIAYASEREQFGRPIARFQAVAHSLALIAEHAEEARLATEAAAILYDHSSLDAAAVAKIVTGDAATLVAARAHQVHAGVGMTEEYQLHRHTRSLWAWSAEYGTADEWTARVGRDLLPTAPSALWSRFTDRASVAEVDTPPAEVTANA